VHQHQWQETQRTFVPPPNLARAWGQPPDLMREFAFGMTTIEDRCRICNKLRVVRALGNVTEDRRS
jgi:hypothetical protein